MLRGKRVFLTGHTGFKGGWLCLCLERLGCVVHGFSLPAPTNPSLFEDAHVAERLERHVVGDVNDRKALAGAMDDANPDLVVHLAAQSLVREGHRDPVGTFATNVMGTVHLLDAVRRRGGQLGIIVVTSDKWYHNDGCERPFRETDRLGGNDPYSASKGAAEIVVDAYRSSYFGPDSGIHLATVRAGNVIGGGDWAPDRLVPDAIRALEVGRSIGVRCPQAIRPWQHVLDPLGGYLELAARLLGSDGERFARAWNFGPARAGVAVRNILDRIIGTWGGGAWEQTSNPADPREAGRLELDSSDAATELGWRPVWDVDAAVERTVRWYRGRFDGGNAADLCARDIDDWTAVSAENGSSP